jgi:uncharacterized phage protein (TIGR02218 family)
MPHSISSELLAHMQSASRTLAFLVDITSVYNTSGTPDVSFTTLDRPITYDGITYSSSVGISPSSIMGKSNLDASNLTIDGWLVAGNISKNDLQSGYYRKAAITILQVNYEDLTQGHLMHFSGHFGTIRTSDSGFSVDIEGLEEYFEQNIGRVFQRNCTTEFCSEQCGLLAADYTETGTVVSISSNNKVFTSTLTNVNGNTIVDSWYSNGYLTWSTGLNERFVTKIRNYVLTGNVITLIQPMYYQIQVGDTFSLIAGCSKNFIDDCDARFSNYVNFQGFPFIPTEDEMNQRVDINITTSDAKI